MKVPVAVAWSDDNFDLILRGMMRKPADDSYSFSYFLGIVTEYWPRAPSQNDFRVFFRRMMHSLLIVVI